MRRLSVIAACAATLLAGVANAREFILVTHSDGTDPFWPVVDRGAQDAAKQVGVKLEIRHPTRTDAVEMAQLIETAIARKPDGLIVSIPDGNVIGAEIQKAVGMGIPVISINSGGDVAHKYGVLFHVGLPEFDAGKGAGEKAKVQGVTKSLCVVQEPANLALRQRCSGYASVFNVEPNIVAASNDPAEIKARTAASIAANPTADGILATGPQVCAPVHDAIVESGREGKIHLSCFDVTPQVIGLIKSGGADFSVDQQQYLQGYLPVVGLDLYLKYKVTPGSDILSGPGFVTKDNADTVKELAGKYR
jgi:simple sugar transport system substrate-binding protein